MKKTVINVPTANDATSREVASKLARTSSDTVVLLSDAVRTYAASHLTPWEAPHFVDFVCSHPARETSSILGAVAAFGQATDRIMAVTCPPMRMHEQTAAGETMNPASVAHRQYLCRAAMGAAPDLKIACDIGVRRETRLHDRNAWPIINAPGRWAWTVLPRSHRVVVVFGNGGTTAWTFDRLNCVPLAAMLWAAKCNAVLDCVVDASGFFVFDALSVADMNLCPMGLEERLKFAKAHFSSSSCSGFAEYNRPSRAMYEAARKMNKSDGTRLLLVDPGIAYKPAAMSRDAYTWRPPIPQGHAILCCRCGDAMSLAAEDHCLMWEEGPVTFAAPPQHMGTYECVYDKSTRGWTAVRPAKRGEPLFTRDQVEKVRDGGPSPSGAAMFAPLFPVAKQKETPKSDEDGFTIVGKRKK
jgi:hypothetical protein